MGFLLWIGAEAHAALKVSMGQIQWVLADGTYFASAPVPRCLVYN